MNITLLYNNGFKISKIAKIPEEQIPEKVHEIIANTSENSHAINAIKLAMVNFDQNLFYETYNSLLAEKSFKTVFYEVFIPLLTELGLLWQTDTISPAHEHFITNLIKQKIYVHTEKLQTKPPTRHDKVFALFLPENEIHEIGLLYVNYEILLKGYKTIYLGQTMPLENLSDLLKYYDNLCFVSYFTVSPTKDRLEKYIADFSNNLNRHGESRLWVLGRQVRQLELKELPPVVTIFESIEELSKSL